MTEGPLQLAESTWGQAQPTWAFGEASDQWIHGSEYPTASSRGWGIAASEAYALPLLELPLAPPVLLGAGMRDAGISCSPTKRRLEHVLSARYSPRASPSLKTPRASRKASLQSTPQRAPRASSPWEQTRVPSTPRRTLQQTSSEWGSFTPPRLASSFARRPSLSFCGTPEVSNPFLFTPPCGPGAYKRNISDELDAAVQEASLPQLCFALQCGQQETSHMIFEAVRHQHPQALEMFLNATDFSDQCDKHSGGRRPLHLAIQFCMTRGDTGYIMAQQLLSRGANPNHCDGDSTSKLSGQNYEGAPMLLEAAKRGNIALVELLLSYGADPNLADAEGHTALHIACRASLWQLGSLYHPIVDLLLWHGASPVQADTAGSLPRCYALDDQLRNKMERAERWWCLQPLSVVRGRKCRDSRVGNMRGVVAALVEVAPNEGMASVDDRPVNLGQELLPDIMEMIVAFL